MAFNLPVQNFFSRTIQPEPYVRPVDWPVITDVPNEVQFLMSDINNASCTIRTNFSRTSGTQDIIIDWGDGTTNTVSATSQTDTTHQYVVGSGTPCSLGYTTFKVRVYFTGTGVSILQVCRLFNILLTGNTTGAPFSNVGLLEIYYGDGTQTSQPSNYYESNTTSSFGSFGFLEYAKLPSSVGWAGAVSLFRSCSSLAVVVMPTSASALQNITSMFFNCFSLRSCIFPSNSTIIAGMSNVFSGCSQLVSVTLPTSLNSCSTFSSTFFNCYSLKNITLPSINVGTTFSNMCTSCSSLEWIRFTSLPTFASSTVVTATSLFQNCTNLQNVYFPASCSTNANYNFNNAFLSCVSLRVVVFPSGFNPNNLQTTFSGCQNLKSVGFLSGASNLANMNSTFINCFSLVSVTLPSSVSPSGINMSSTFAQCSSLKTITIPNNYLFTNLAQAFLSCFSLQTINWTPGIQNSLTSLSSTFNGCFLLSSITMPTSMNSLIDITTAFLSCRSLKSITLPASLNTTVSLFQTFFNCNSLTSITLPTSMSSCTSFSQSFQGCSNILSITLPNIVSSALTTFLNAFTECISLATLTFPGAVQLSSVTIIEGMFNSCGNLTTINNFDKIGSLTSTPLATANNNFYAQLLSVSFVMPLSRLLLNGISSSAKTNVQSVRLLNTSAGQWTLTSPQINVSFTNMSTSNLVELFNDMAAQGPVTSKTINITSATGAAGLTAADRLIVTSKGWTITG